MCSVDDSYLCCHVFISFLYACVLYVLLCIQVVTPEGRQLTYPSEVAQVVLHMMDGSTHWQSGDCVICLAGPSTLNMSVRYGTMTVRDQEEKAALLRGRYDWNAVCDARGQPRRGGASASL